MKKAISLILLFVMTATLFSGCGLPFRKTTDKTFTKAGLSITLTSDFSEQDLASQTAYYVSKQVIVTTLKEEFSLFENINMPAEMSLTEYAQLVIENNKIESEITQEDGLTSFLYKKEMNGKNITYYATVFRSTDAFWLVQFACDTEQFEEYKPQFIQYAKTVTFEP